jgi:saccharopine dehydrogenase-like NADP-dependent oxidoreductase
MLALDNIFIPDEFLGEPVSAIRIEIKGQKDGQPKEIVYGGSALTVSSATAGPTAIGVLMLAQGDIKKKGVYAPEGCIDNFGKFMTELKKRGRFDQPGS